MTKWNIVRIGGIACWLAFSLFSFGQGSIVAKESDARAALIYQLICFTEWPVSKEGERPVLHPIVLGVSSDDGVHGSLEVILQGKGSVEQSVKLVWLTQSGSQRPLQVLYINQPYTWKRLAEQMLGEPVLCIGSYPEFLEDGGDILLSREGDHMAFEVHLDRLRDKGLSLDAQVLRLAQTVHQEGLQ